MISAIWPKIAYSRFWGGFGGIWPLNKEVINGTPKGTSLRENTPLDN